MNIALWICQVVLAGLFLFSAATKGTQSPEKLVAMGQTGVEGLPILLLRFIAFAETLGAIGLIVPFWTKIDPVLTPAAALGLGIIMVLACIVHVRRRELQTASMNFVILAVCLFVAFGRPHA
ncbi:MAG: DoxX family protein [Vulcanimicrobiaceae bacterium]